MAYGEAKVYFDGSHYVAIPHTERPQKPRALKIEKEIVVNENNEMIAEYDEVKSTITLPSGKVLDEVEFEGNELKPVVKKINQSKTENSTVESLVGEEVVVTKIIKNGEVGEIKSKYERYSAIAPSVKEDILPNTKVKILEIRGNKVIVDLV